MFDQVQTALFLSADRRFIPKRKLIQRCIRFQGKCDYLFDLNSTRENITATHTVVHKHVSMCITHMQSRCNGQEA